MDQVGVIFRMKKCLLSVWEAMKGDGYMHFAVTKFIPLIPCGLMVHHSTYYVTCSLFLVLCELVRSFLRADAMASSSWYSVQFCPWCMHWQLRQLYIWQYSQVYELVSSSSRHQPGQLDVIQCTLLVAWFSAIRKVLFRKLSKSSCVSNYKKTWNKQCFSYRTYQLRLCKINI